jgi:hypothetical protein
MANIRLTTGVPGDPNALAVGESTIPRYLATLTTGNPGTGRLTLAYFTATKAETVTSIKTITGGTAAAATPTLCKMGVYSVADNGDLTLVGQTANDTTLFAAASTAYTRALATSFTKVAGQRYAFAQLVVTAAASPTFVSSPGGNNAETGVAPRMSGSLTGQTDLPASIASGSVAAWSSPLYAVLLP